MNFPKLQQMILKVTEFNHVRGWHSAPQDIAKSIVIEAAELLEHFQWDSDHSLPSKSALDGKDIKEIKHEVADVLWYLINFCNETGIDMAEALELKHEHNQEKYPASMFMGSHNQEFYKAQKKKYRDAKK